MILFAGDYVIVDPDKSPDLYESWELVVDTRDEDVVLWNGARYHASEDAIAAAMSAPEFVEKFNSY